MVSKTCLKLEPFVAKAIKIDCQPIPATTIVSKATITATTSESPSSTTTTTITAAEMPTVTVSASTHVCHDNDLVSRYVTSFCVWECGLSCTWKCY
jgi:hypothetical protein